MIRPIITLIILMTISLPLNVHAAFKIYLKNGRIITGVNRVEEGDKIKMYKGGIILELPKTDVIKIEEYKLMPAEKKTAEEIREGEKPPEYLRYEKRPEVNKKERLQQIKNQYQQVIKKLERIEALEQRSSELQRAIHKKAYSPRKARMLKQEKALVDEELKNLLMQKDSLLQEKVELESQIETLEGL